MDPPVTFGGWLERRRKALGLTRAQLAQRVGCSVSALRKIETGERRPSRQIAELLANSLELSPEMGPIFVKAARGELGVERLPAPGPTAGAPRSAPSAPPRLGQRGLPVEATPLVGRQKELADLLSLLADPTCRLVTLAGPGGVGKTRLALSAARCLEPDLPDGAAFVALAPLTSVRFVVPAIAEALGFGFSGPANPQDQLFAHLRDSRMLLVLDNFEHLLADDAAELVVELLQAAPALKLLVTSREVLNVQAEWVYVVPGLAGLDEAGGEGVQLFRQRAQRADVGFVPSAADLRAIARICRLVEGLPLAIELAAGWVRTLSCVEIAEEIERNPTGLAGSMRDLPARHRSLRTVFEHSWVLLPAQEQAVLMKLSVFRGGFRRAAAEAVAGATLELLSALAAKSLVRRGAGGRYDLHELVRQDAGERLRGSGEEEVTRQAHSKWVITFARTAQSHQYTPAAAAWLDEVEREHHNVRETFRWALEPVNGETAEHRLAAGMALLGALFEFWFVRGHHHEALSFAEQLLARPAAARCLRERLPVLTHSGYFYYLLDRHAEARVVLDEAVRLSQSLGDRAQQALALEHWALVAMAEGDPAAAQEALAKSLGLWRELKAGFQQAGVLSHLGDIALAQQDFGGAERLYAEAINPGGNLPENVRHPYPPRRLAYLALRRGDCGRAAEWARESLRLNEAIQDWRAMAACLAALASVARTRGQATRAAQLCGAAEGMLASIGASLLPSDRQEYERTVADLRRMLPETDLAAAWSVGRAFSLEQAVDYAQKNE